MARKLIENDQILKKIMNENLEENDSHTVQSFLMQKPHITDSSEFKIDKRRFRSILGAKHIF